MKVIPETRRGH